MALNLELGSRLASPASHTLRPSVEVCTVELPAAYSARDEYSGTARYCVAKEHPIWEWKRDGSCLQTKEDSKHQWPRLKEGRKPAGVVSIAKHLQASNRMGDMSISSDGRQGTKEGRDGQTYFHRALRLLPAFVNLQHRLV
eukprot:4080611-Pleurochrysis_carterae.AAC.2